MCSVAGCLNQSRANGFCRKHYMRVRTHGSPHTILKTGGTSKLTPAKVRAIRLERAGGASTAALAGRYGVTRKTINMVVRRAAWAEVE